MNGLTDRTIQSLRPAQGDRITSSDTGGRGVRGLSILASYGGTKTFYFRYKTPQGKLKRVRLGGYPQLSLLEARRKAREYKAQIDSGIDLAAVIRKESLTDREIHTIEQLWIEYFMDARTRKKSAEFEAQLWRKHLAPDFANLDIRSFTRDTILDFLIPYRRDHSPALAARVQAIISQLGSYAVERRVLEHSPAYQLGKQKPLPSCDRFLSRYELSKFWLALSDDSILVASTVSQSLACALKLSISTSARRGEIAGMEWSEIDLETKNWTIPGSRTKNGRPHVLPLTEQVLSTLRDCKMLARRANSPFVFPGRRTEAVTKGKGHIRGDSITRACARLNVELKRLYGVEKFTPHDLRRTAATYMASSLKVDRFIISQILNHRSDKGGGATVTSIYARYDYMDEKRVALDAWSEFIVANEEAFS